VSALLESLAEGAAALAPPRRAALERALAAGLPSQRNERWKYTSLRALAARRFTLDPGSADTRVDAALLASIEGPRLVFINGEFSPELTRFESTPGLHFGWQPDWDAEPGLEPFERADEVFASLNRALERGGALVDVADDACVEAPLPLVLIGTPIDLTRILKIEKPMVRARYDLDVDDPALREMVLAAVRG